MKNSKMPVLVVMSMIACMGLAACGNTSSTSPIKTSSSEPASSSSEKTSSSENVSSSEKVSSSESAKKNTNRVEAEDAVLKGTNITAVEETGSNASNGKHVGNLYNGEIRWYLDSDKAEKGELSFCFATADAAVSSFNDWFMVSINDEVVMPKTSDLTRTENGWWKWYTYDFNEITLVKGTNTITLAGLQTTANSTNIDYLEISSYATVTEHAFTATDKKDYLFTGDNATLTNCSMTDETNHNAWRNRHVGTISTGSVISYLIHTEAEQTVDLAARVALVTSTDFNEMYSVKINDADLTIADGAIDATASTAWDSYHMKSLGSVKLNSGNNTISFTVKALPTNFDFLRISSTAEVTKGTKIIDSDVTGDSYYLEAEDGTLTGFSTEDNGSAHGGKDVGGVNAGNGSITFAFTSDETATITLYIAYAQPNTFTSTATLALNSVALVIPTSFTSTGGWSTFGEAKLCNTDVKAGANSLVFTNNGGDFGNIDYIRVISPKTIKM